MSDVIIPVEQDKPTIDKNSIIDKPHTDEPHNGSPITKLAISPNGKYLVTYSEKDNSIVGWNVEDIDEGRLNPDITVQTITTKEPDGTVHQIKQICVSDDKKLAYIYVHKSRKGWNQLKIVDMNNGDHKIELSGEIERDKNRSEFYSNYCTFNLSNQFILHGSIYCYNSRNDYCIWIYSTQTKNMIWTYEKENHHKITKDFKLIGISKDKDKFYLLSNNSIYEWDVHTGRVIGGIFVNEIDKVEITKGGKENGKDKVKEVLVTGTYQKTPIIKNV